jgi:uncharacterized membrane protein
LSCLIIEFHNELLESEEFKSFVANTKIEKAQPCALTLEDPMPHFSDIQSLIPNNMLDACEQSEIDLIIKNNGQGTAFDTNLEITSDNHAIAFEKSYKVGDIPPGEKKEIKIPIKADIGISDGKSNIQIVLREKRGYDSRKVVLSIPIAKLQKPQMEIVTTEINDGNTGLASGNGNGIIESGETVELTAFIRNTGVGSALGVNLIGENITSGVQWERGSTLVGAIQPGETAKAKLAFSVPRNFTSANIEPALKVMDVRGVGGTDKKVAYAFQKRSSNIQYAYHITKDGRPVQDITNGETYEIAFDVSNTGKIAARNVSLNLSAGNGVTLSNSTISLGEIKNGASAPGQKVTLSIPRTFTGAQVPLMVDISQADFAAVKNTINLPVEVKAPRLTYTAELKSKSGLNILEQGESAVLEINVVNNGNMAAEGVKVSIDSKEEYLSIRGNKEFLIGTIPPNSTSDTQRFQLDSRNRLQVGTKNLPVTISQTDFPGLTEQYIVSIKEEGTTVIDVAAEETRMKYASTAAAGPVIALKTPQDVVTTDNDSYSLKFAANDKTRIDKVSVTVNGMNIPIEASEVIGLATGKLEVLKSIPLIVGMNTVIISTRNTDNQISNKTIAITRTAGMDVDKAPLTGMNSPDAIAVVIGISQYENSQVMPPVDYAVHDAKVMKEYLVKTLGFEEAHVFEVYDSDARCIKLKSLLKKVKNTIDAKPGKTDVLIYYSGHGIPDPDTKEAFFAPYDFDPELIEDTGYKLKDFYDMLGSMKARNTTVVIDACFSGSSGDGKMLIKKASPGILIVSDPLRAAKDTVSFCSSASQQISNWYPEKKHGLFTYYYLTGLQGKANLNNDGQITVSEMDNYLQETVPQQALRLYNRTQTPVVKGNTNQVVLIIK